MTTLLYELAKELDAAGWKQPRPAQNGCPDGGEGDYVYWPTQRPAPDSFWDADAPGYYSPSLSELIAACPPVDPAGYELALRYEKADTGRPAQWRAGYYGGDATPFSMHGATPEIAIARLWLALQKEKVR